MFNIDFNGLLNSLAFKSKEARVYVKKKLNELRKVVSEVSSIVGYPVHESQRSIPIQPFFTSRSLCALCWPAIALS